jgi:3-oxoadipate enol-lactonase
VVVCSVAHVTTLAAEDLDIYYETVGAGPHLLIFNGSGMTIASSRVLINFLSASFTVLVHDQRGLGRTGLPSQPKRFTMADYAADAAALLDHVGWPSVRVFGISFGGMVAQELAVTRPDRVERLALLCTSAGGAGGSSYPLHELEELDAAERETTLRQLLDTRFDDRWLASHPADAQLVDLLAARGQAGSGVTGEGPGRGVSEQFAARSRHDVWDRLGAISCPTLVASGRYDGIAPMGNGRAIASRISHADFRVYDGGHLFVVQDPAALPDVIAFLS